MDGGLCKHAVVCVSLAIEFSLSWFWHGYIHSSSDFLRGGVLPAMMISLALPDRKLLSVDL